MSATALPNPTTGISSFSRLPKDNMRDASSSLGHDNAARRTRTAASIPPQPTNSSHNSLVCQQDNKGVDVNYSDRARDARNEPMIRLTVVTAASTRMNDGVDS